MPINKQQEKFVIALVELASAIIKSDEEVNQQEMKVIETLLSDAFADNYLKSYVKKIVIQIMVKRIEKEKIIADINEFIESKTEALVLIHFLLNIIGADGIFKDKEVDVLKGLAKEIGLDESCFSALTHIFFRSDSSVAKAKKIVSEKLNECHELEKIYNDLFKEYYTSDNIRFGQEINFFIEKKLAKLA